MKLKYLLSALLFSFSGQAYGAGSPTSNYNAYLANPINLTSSPAYTPASIGSTGAPHAFLINTSPTGSLYYNASGVISGIPPSTTAGYVLTSNGVGVAPSFQAATGGGGGSGTITNIATGTGLTGGPITSTGTISVANGTANTLAGFNASGVFSGVTPGANCTLASGVFNCTGGTGGSNPGGSDTQVQFNNGGVFAGASGLTYSSTTSAVTVASASTSAFVVQQSGASYPALQVDSSASSANGLKVSSTTSGTTLLANGANATLNLTSSGTGDVVIGPTGTTRTVGFAFPYTNATKSFLVGNGSVSSNGITILNGPLQHKRTYVTDANYTVLITDYLVAYTSLTATRAVTLPTGAGNTSLPIFFIIKDESGQAGTYPITFSQTIDGSASQSIHTAYGEMRVYWDGVAFFTW